MALENNLRFYFLLSRESGSGSYCDLHLFKSGAGFFGKFLGGDVMAITPCVYPGEMPHVGHSPTDDAGEVADLFGEPSGSVSHDHQAGDVDPGKRT
jgi:hypothetical protein